MNNFKRLQRCSQLSNDARVMRDRDVQQRRSDCGALAGAIGSFIILALLVLVVLAYVFGTVVPPGMMGVRQVKLGPAQGFSRTALPPGYHWSVPGYSVIHVLPREVRILDMTRDRRDDEVGGTLRGGVRDVGASFDSLEVITTDGATVDVDVSVLYRLYPAAGERDGKPHGGPADLIHEFGLSPTQWISRIRVVSSDQLRQTLGQLSASDFYQPFPRGQRDSGSKREEQVRLAFERIRDILAPYGIQVEAVLLRRYTYRADRIDQAIFAKNLQDQEERLNAMASNLAQAKAELEEVAARRDAEIETLRVQGENQAQVLRSEGDLLEAQAKAEGDLELARARAEVDRAKAAALAADGASAYLSRQLAPLLETVRGGVVSSADPLDIDAWRRRLGVAESSSTSKRGGL